jgi:hypothetical protein
MKTMLSEGELKNYRYVANLSESRGAIDTDLYHFATQKVTLFMSHKHSDLENLRDVIGFLEKDYNVKVYIDSQDPSMPKVTSGETASKIKDRIKSCKKFMLLATNDAIDSKWCNWELGFGDAHKYKDDIALFPLKLSGQSDSAYKGSEYMSIYPYIAQYDGSEKYSNGTSIQRGFYIVEQTESGRTITPLSDWLKK